MEITKEWLQQKWIKEGVSLRQLGIDLGLGPRGLESYAAKYGLRSQYKNHLNEQKLTLEDPVFRYFLGLFCADGYMDKNAVRVSIDLYGEDSRVLLEKLRQYFEITTPLGNYKTPLGDRNRWRLTIASSKLYSLLSELGISNKKTENLRLVQLENYSEFLRGFVDGDGSFSAPPKRRVRWYCHSVQFNEDLMVLLQMGTIAKHPKGGTTFCIAKRKDLEKFIRMIYTDTYYCLSYKLEIAEQILSK